MNWAPSWGSVEIIAGQSTSRSLDSMSYERLADGQKMGSIRLHLLPAVHIYGHQTAADHCVWARDEHFALAGRD